MRAVLAAEPLTVDADLDGSPEPRDWATPANAFLTAVVWPAAAEELSQRDSGFRPIRRDVGERVLADGLGGRRVGQHGADLGLDVGAGGADAGDRKIRLLASFRVQTVGLIA